MWWTSKKDNHVEESSLSSKSGVSIRSRRGSNKKNKKRHHLMGGSNHRQPQNGDNHSAASTSNSTTAPQDAPPTPSAAAPNNNLMHVAETGSGIEVSFSDDTATPEKTQSPKHAQQRQQPGVLFREQLAYCSKVYRSQYSASSTNNPHPMVGGASSTDNDQQYHERLSQDFRTVRKHRVPFLGKAKKAQPKFDDVLFLLRSAQVMDEFHAVHEEMEYLDAELLALEADRNELQQLHQQKHRRAFSPSSTTGAASQSPTATAAPTPASPRLVVPDVNRLLASQHKLLSNQDRATFQERRGLCLTVAIEDEAARNSFLSKAGAIKSRTATDICLEDDVVQQVDSIRPDNCRDGGAATTVQQACFINEQAGFFMSRDKGKAYCSGRLPDRLYQRLQSSKQHAAPDLIYLATGPLGSYFAEFRSGETWWGSIPDVEFHALCQDWDVARVAFGPCSILADESRKSHCCPSWVMVARDGRVAWKNVPARLHRQLENRMASQAVPAEVALGAHGAFFVRYADGQMDYCLPASAARVLHAIEERGATITNVSLHPESSRDFIIRHSVPGGGGASSPKAS